MAAHEHKARGPARVRCFVVTISDTRTEATDTSGQAARQRIEAAGHEVAGSRVVKDEPGEVAALVERLCASGETDVIITTGGTGVSRRDSTYEALSGLLEKRLDGFGELFRMLSYQEIGGAAMLSRAQAGVRAGRIVVSLPGSPNACRLALEKLLLPELGHLVREVNR